MDNNNRYSVKKENRILHGTLIVCLVVFIIAITMLIINFNKLILEHDRYLSGEICTLVSEKINNYIYSLSDNNDQLAASISAMNYQSLDDVYEKLSGDEYVESQYAGIGFVDSDGRLYATEEEKEDFDRWKLLYYTNSTENQAMSIPYRSEIYGKAVITMFSKITYANDKTGWLFVTYLFENLQEIAETNSNISELEIWLMNANSLNIIQCVATDEHAIGSWTNAYLRMQDVSDEASKEVYLNWLEQLRNGVSNMGLNYNIGETGYSLYCNKIESAPEWYVVVRIPNKTLSSTMSKFRNQVITFTVALLVIAVVIILTMYKLNRRENDILENISFHDALTGLLNRRAFSASANEWLESGKYNVLSFFDIDNFKEVNDNLGHEKGDELLVTFSSILSANLGDKAEIFRYGGDEFVALIAVEDFDEFNQTLKKTLDCVHNIKLAGFFDDLDKRMSFSAGLAQYPSDADDLNELIRCADKALYRIKESGRNGYCWYKMIKKD